MNRDDPELEAIRQKRMQQLMAGGASQNEVTPEQMQHQEEMKREVEERRQALLRQVLQPEAKDRLSRIRLVKPEKAQQVEDMILSQARSGLPGKISEEQLIGILEQVKEKSEKSSKVIFQRRRNILDDDD